MIQRTYYKELERGKLQKYIKTMQDILFKSRGLDGQKNSKTNGEINQGIKKTRSKQNQLIINYLNDCQNLNIHPDVLKISYIQETSLYPFNDVKTSPNYRTFDDENDIFTQDHSSYSDHYIEKEVLNEFIRKWHEIAKKSPPKKRNKVSFFCNTLVRIYLNDCIINGKTSDFKFYNKELIYVYRNNKKSCNSRFRKIKTKFLSNYEKYYKRLELLSDQETFSNKVYITSEKNIYYGLGEIEVFKNTSSHFQEIMDEFYELQNYNPELFGVGHKPILEGLHKRLLDKHPNSDYWLDYDKFKLRIQQQYIYISNQVKHLRIDLFRNLSNNGEFEGGIWHAFQHFVMNGKPLSAKRKATNEFYESYFFDAIEDAFFFSEWTERETNNQRGKEYEAKVNELGEPNKDRVIAFYYDPFKDLHYLKTVMVKEKKIVKETQRA